MRNDQSCFEMRRPMLIVFWLLTGELATGQPANGFCTIDSRMINSLFAMSYER
jgi:hypothetical protein